MTKQVSWNKPLYDEFLRLAYLSEFQRKVMDMHVIARAANYQIAMQLNVSEATVNRTIRELKQIYDSVQVHSSVLPLRKADKNLTEK